MAWVYKDDTSLTRAGEEVFLPLDGFVGREDQPDHLTEVADEVRNAIRANRGRDAESKEAVKELQLYVADRPGLSDPEDALDRVAAWDDSLRSNPKLAYELGNSYKVMPKDKPQPKGSTSEYGEMLDAVREAMKVASYQQSFPKKKDTLNALTDKYGSVRKAVDEFIATDKEFKEDPDATAHRLAVRYGSAQAEGRVDRAFSEAASRAIVRYDDFHDLQADMSAAIASGLVPMTGKPDKDIAAARAYVLKQRKAKPLTEYEDVAADVRRSMR